MTIKNNNRYYSVFVTTHDQKEAEHVGGVVVKEKLAACITILPGATSIYRWSNKINKSTEVVFFAKTNKQKLPALIQRIKTLHSYESPCIVALAIEDGDADYLQWIDVELA